MSFSNPIIGGNDTIVRQAMQSDGFSLDAESNVSGWRLERDGSSYFTNVTVGNTNYFIDENGNAAFNDVAVNGSLSVAGEALGDILAALPQGPRAATILLNDSGTTTAGTTGGVVVGRIVLTDADVSRFYRMFWQIRINVANNPTYLGIAVYAKWDGNASQTDSFIFRQQWAGRAASGVGDYAAGSNTFDLSNVAGTGTNLNFVVYLYASAAGTLMAGNFPNNRLIIDDVGPAVTFTTYDASAGTTPTQQYTKTYSATWSRSWDDQGSSVHSTNGELVQGYWSGSGQRLSWIGFPFSTIQSDLSGATVQKVEVYLYYDHWYNNAGGTAILGYHNSTATSAPAYDASKDNLNELQVPGWGINVGKWVNITSAGAFTADGWRTGAHTGIAIGYGPTTSLEYYGKARGNTEANEPRLRITYTK